MDIHLLFRLGMDRDIPPLVDGPPGMVLNLGAGRKRFHGAVNLDLPEWNADTDMIPCEDEVVGTIHAHHFLEHLENPITILAECQRVLKVGGVLNIVVPYYTSQMAAHDLTHRRVFCEETWRVLFGNPYYTNARIAPVPWRFKVGTNIIIGIVERNLCLMTQLIKG